MKEVAKKRSWVLITQLCCSIEKRRRRWDLNSSQDFSRKRIKGFISRQIGSGSRSKTLCQAIAALLFFISLTHTLSLFLSNTHSNTFFTSLYNSLTYLLTHTLSLSHTHTHTQTHTLFFTHLITHSLSLSLSLSISFLFLHNDILRKRNKAETWLSRISKVKLFP